MTDVVRAMVVIRSSECASVKYEVVWANGSEGDAKQAAEEWCRKNPGREAWVMVATAASPAKAGMTVSWQS